MICSVWCIFIHFLHHLQQHNKQYDSPVEELHRHTIWQSNKKYIDGHNEHAADFGYTLAMNKFGDLVSEITVMTESLVFREMRVFGQPY